MRDGQARIRAHREPYIVLGYIHNVLKKGLATQQAPQPGFRANV
jgi:hypothetical protein